MSQNLPTTRPKSASLRRVALVLLLFFGTLEGFTRFKLFEMSRDLRRFKTYPQRAAQLHAAPHLRVAFLGNSATERGLDLNAVRRDFASHGIAATTDEFVADASHINTWKWMANHLFWHPNQAPDVLIVPFFNRSLQDGNDIEIGRLAQFFTAPREIPDALAALPDAGSRLDFAASKVWATYAARERLKERVLSLILPDYQGFTEGLHAADAPTKSAPQARTYRDLTQLLAAAKSHHCQLIFIDLPLRDHIAPLDSSLAARLQNAGARFLDLRHLPGLKPESFDDSIHLNPQGRAAFMPQLLRALTPLLRQKKSLVSPE